MNTILATENGPLECNGEFELMAADGTYLAHETQTWLCRCGRSQAKPYCDGSHKTTGFSDPATGSGSHRIAGERTAETRRSMRGAASDRGCSLHWESNRAMSLRAL